MKKFLFFAVFAAFFAGCAANSNGSLKEKSFAEQYAALENEPVPPTQPADGALTFQTPEERARQVEIDSQRERRAQAPLVESNYIFRVMPDRKNVYSYDEYNQVWTDEPKVKDYKETKRLWNKPKRYEGDVTTPAVSSSSPDASAPSDDFSYMDENWGGY
jgi:hypothetical protein